MLTRQMRNKEERRKGYTMKLLMKGSPQKFRNPSSNFKLSDALYINEGKLITPDDRSGCLAALFDFNRIVRCNSQKFMVKCQLEAFDHSNTSLSYLLQRLRSFGDRDLFQICNKIEQVSFYKTDYIPQNKARSIPSTETILSHYQEGLYLILVRDLVPKATTFNQIYFSKDLIETLGYSEQEFMLNATKFGCLGTGQASDLNFLTVDYTKQLNFYLDSQLFFKRLMESPDPVCWGQLEKLLKLETTWKIINKNKETMDWKCTMTTPTPNMIVIRFGYVEPPKTSSSQTIEASTASSIQTEGTFVNFIQEEEISVLRHLIIVPENMLTINKAFVCNYRDIV